MADRRPIATRETGWAKSLAAGIARTGLTANAASVLGAVFAVLAGTALVLSDGPGWRAWLVVAAAGIQLRLLCNMLDGMVAVPGQRRHHVELVTPVGELLGDLGHDLAGRGHVGREVRAQDEQVHAPPSSLRAAPPP